VPNIVDKITVKSSTYAIEDARFVSNGDQVVIDAENMYIGEISPDNKVLTAGDPIVAGGISTEATTARRYLVGVASVSGANQETNTNAGVYVTNGTLYAQQYSGLPVFTYNSLVGGVAGVVPGFSLAQNIDVANSYLRADGTFAPVTVSSAITSVPAA